MTADPKTLLDEARDVLDAAFSDMLNDPEAFDSRRLVLGVEALIEAKLRHIEATIRASVTVVSDATGEGAKTEAEPKPAAEMLPKLLRDLPAEASEWLRSIRAGVVSTLEAAPPVPVPTGEGEGPSLSALRDIGQRAYNATSFEGAADAKIEAIRDAVRAPLLARIAELEKDNKRRRDDELAAINAMVDARRRAMDAEYNREMDRMLAP